MKTFNNLPLFSVSVEDDECTITTISLVENPAMQLPMYCFADEKNIQKFAIQDESKHCFISCIVRCDYPIYRVDAAGNEFYIVFDKETSKRLCQKLLRDGFQQNISLDHNGELISGIELQEVFIKDSSKGISPVGFEDAADGSLFGIYHVSDENLWRDCIEGRFGGVSLESYLHLEQFKQIKKNNNHKFMSKLKNSIKALLLQFSEVETDKGILTWEEDGEIMVGYAVYMDGEPAADGEYVAGENIIVVAEGKVAEIKPVETPAEDPAPAAEPEMPVEPEPAQAAEEPAPVAEPEMPVEPAPVVVVEDDEDMRIRELEDRIAKLEADMAELVAKVAEIAVAPAAAPVEDEFEQVVKKQKTGNSRLDKAIAIASAFKK